jgi:hypothetical protein
LKTSVGDCARSKIKTHLKTCGACSRPRRDPLKTDLGGNPPRKTTGGSCARHQDRPRRRQDDWRVLFSFPFLLPSRYPADHPHAPCSVLYPWSVAPCRRYSSEATEMWGASRWNETAEDVCAEHWTKPRRGGYFGSAWRRAELFPGGGCESRLHPRAPLSRVPGLVRVHLALPTICARELNAR